jgi:segregation and condensation protein A
MAANVHAPALKISQFEGPLDLLYHLIEKNQIDIYDIPIAEITDQYIDYLDGLAEIDMDLASDFLVMASTLIHLKSRLLLPHREKDLDDGIDPREELVLRLLEYRRCKTLALELKRRHQEYAGTWLRMPEPPVRLGVSLEKDPGGLDWEIFIKTCRVLMQRNRARFQDERERMSGMLKREKISLKDKMTQIWRTIREKTRLFFNELFPSDRTSRAERITAFLALLELLRLNRVKARQDKPFDVILIEKNQADGESEKEPWDDHIAKLPVEEKAYD